MKPKVVVVCGDPGGTSAVAPVITQLEHDGIVEVVQYPGAEPDAVDLLLTTTSGIESDLEKNCIQTAKRYGVPSISVLDFWSNYTERFCDEWGNLVYLPDKIAIMDDHAYNEMIELGFPPGKLVITGQPAFDCLEDKRAKFKPHHKYWVRRGHGIHPDKKLVVFASQPHSREPYDFGYTEHTVLTALINALSCLDNGIHLVIRPHPREREADLLMYESAGNPYVTVKRKGDVHDLLMAADLVVGMNTELLVESCYLGCITLSLQPGMKGTDRLPTNRLRVSIPFYKGNDAHFMWALPIILEADDSFREFMKGRLDNFRITEPAAPKVAQLIYELIGV